MEISVSGLVRCYGKAEALRGVDLEIPSVRTLVLIGPSGGGKSTLLRLLGGLEPADAGIIRMNGQELLMTPPAMAAWRKQRGFLFQQFNLFPHMTALRNITLPLEKVHGLTPENARTTALACLERFGLTPWVDKMPAQLSGGQQQRVGLARAIAAQPQVLLLDEPTSALDPEMTAEVLELIQELAQSGQQIILSTHEMGFARAAADHVAFVAEGQILQHGPPASLFDHPAEGLVQRFLSKVMRY
jgi:polar amino acid transport system ATP-binding protein